VKGRRKAGEKKAGKKQEKVGETGEKQEKGWRKIEKSRLY
jgi:hypothetical protein